METFVMILLFIGGIFSGFFSLKNTYIPAQRYNIVISRSIAFAGSILLSVVSLISILGHNSLNCRWELLIAGALLYAIATLFSDAIEYSNNHNKS